METLSVVDCEIPEKAIPQGRPFNPGWLHVLVIFAGLALKVIETGYTAR